VREQLVSGLGTWNEPLHQETDLATLDTVVNENLQGTLDVAIVEWG